jgi:bifunctional DNA-binding transcriptional regulator/antitoxin component of YhaV-PrlF toxin-antitoxin module
MATNTTQLLARSERSSLKVADEVWVATALLHQERPEQNDFSVQEIKARARKEPWGQDLRVGFHQHVSHHCVATKTADPANHRMLSETQRGRRRLFKAGDPCHADRINGKIFPDKKNLPPEYHSLLVWYEAIYSHQPLNGGVDSGNTSESEKGAGVAFVGSSGAFVIPDDLRRELGIREGTRLSIQKRESALVIQPVTKEFVDRVAGSYKGKTSMVDAREQDHRIER